MRWQISPALGPSPSEALSHLPQHSRKAGTAYPAAISRLSRCTVPVPSPTIEDFADALASSRQFGSPPPPQTLALGDSALETRVYALADQRPFELGIMRP
jgi:hypothetical protein